MSNIFYLLGCVCFALGTILNMRKPAALPAAPPAVKQPIPRWPEGHNFHAEPDPHPFDPQYERDQHWTA